MRARCRGSSARDSDGRSARRRSGGAHGRSGWSRKTDHRRSRRRVRTAARAVPIAAGALRDRSRASAAAPAPDAPPDPRRSRHARSRAGAQRRTSGRLGAAEALVDARGFLEPIGLRARKREPRRRIRLEKRAGSRDERHGRGSGRCHGGRDAEARASQPCARAFASSPRVQSARASTERTRMRTSASNIASRAPASSAPTPASSARRISAIRLSALATGPAADTPRRATPPRRRADRHHRTSSGDAGDPASLIAASVLAAAAAQSPSRT